MRSPLFWPIAGALRAVLGDDAERDQAGVGVSPRLGASLRLGEPLPPVEVYGRVFAATRGGRGPFRNGQPYAGDETEPPVRFEAAAPRPRRRGPRREAIDPTALYDARITLERVVPSRPGSWHDFMNALVWGTFPRAKRALHARQHRAIAARIAPGARTLPPTRTRELDALALLDEGGVLLPRGARNDRSGADDAAGGANGGPRDAAPIVFGHAIYESLAFGIPPAVVAAIDLDAGDDLDAIDAALASVIDDPARLLTPEELRRVDLAGLA
jgi:hypothetical protein